MIKYVQAAGTLVLALALQFSETTVVRAEEPLTTESLVKRFLENKLREIAGRKEILFDLSDPRQKLPSCGRVEPFLPLTTPISGRISVGLRCIEGANWTAYRTATVKVFGAAVVAARTLSAGSALTSADYRMAEIEFTQPIRNIITDPVDVLDKTLARAIESGQPLKRDMLRLRVAVTAGDPVRLAYIGSGFSVTTEGKALGSASEGQRVRVQVENGRVLTGVAKGNRVIEVYF
jgi:flagellar basal body P-ring formation protein FlgA